MSESGGGGRGRFWIKRESIEWEKGSEKACLCMKTNVRIKKEKRHDDSPHHCLFILDTDLHEYRGRTDNDKVQRKGLFFLHKTRTAKLQSPDLTLSSIGTAECRQHRTAPPSKPRHANINFSSEFTEGREQSVFQIRPLRPKINIPKL